MTELEKLKRMIMDRITKAIQSTPIVVVEAIVNMEPLHLILIAIAAKVWSTVKETTKGLFIAFSKLSFKAGLLHIPIGHAVHRRLMQM